MGIFIFFEKKALFTGENVIIGVQHRTATQQHSNTATEQMTCIGNGGRITWGRAQRRSGLFTALPTVTMLFFAGATPALPTARGMLAECRPKLTGPLNWPTLF